MTVNWQKYDQVFYHKQKLCKGEEKQLTQSQILEINLALEKMIELNKVISKNFDEAREEFRLT